MQRLIEPEFSRTVDVDAVGDEGFQAEFEATEAERAALARRFGLLGIERLHAAAQLRRGADGRIRAKVTFDADVIQSCVVTLEPLAAHVAETFEASFAPSSSDPGSGIEVEFAFEEEDPPEPIRDGRMELGELVAQHLSLALDPYPRKPGVELPAAEDAGETAAEERPFAALAKLASRRRG